MNNKRCLFIDVREYKINPITQYKVIIPTYKKILGLFSLGIAVFPNGLGFLCYPLGFMLLTNSKPKSLIISYKNKISLFLHKTKLMLLYSSNKYKK